MKNLMMGLLSIFAFVSVASAQTTKTYTERDYDQFTEDAALIFKVSEVAESALDNACGKPALASLAGAIFDQAKDNGVDLPEEINIDSAYFFADASYMMLSSDGADYTILVSNRQSQCVAYPAEKSASK